MFFTNLIVRGNLKLWLRGELPHNLRQLWREKNWWGADPLLRSILAHLGFAVTILSFLFILSLITIVMIDGRIVRHEIIANGSAFAVTLMALSFTFTAGLQGTSGKFYANLIHAKNCLELSFPDIAALSREGLRYHAQECLKDSGANLQAAEQRLSSFSPEVEKLRASFKYRYETFRDLGVIEDVGYGLFIPPKSLPTQE